MYAHIVPPLTRMLNAMAAMLARADAHCAARKIDPAALLNARLFPDMFAFTRQVQLTADFCARAGARLSGADVPAFPDTETSFAELIARVERARDYIAGLDPAAFEGSAERVVTIRMRGQDVSMPGLQYLTVYSLPQVYFHAATAYGILRHNGIEVGKGDFMGA
ncbi:MAG: DUF1993 domain-containing protein [Paracoccaceae bacterium]